MRRFLKLAAVGLAVLIVLVAALGTWALRHSLPGPAALPGQVEVGSLAHGGRTRSWLAYVPARVAARPALVIALHGSMGTAEQARQVYGYDFDRLAEEHGFIAAYPQGYAQHWNDARVRGPFAAKRENVDDTGFLQALVDELVAKRGVDRDRVYVTGVSNGGQMALRLALEAPSLARAYAAVIASLPAPENLAVTPKGEPVSILFMNGTADPFNPWAGGDVVLHGVWGNRGRVLSTRETVDHFARLAGITGSAVTTGFADVDPDDGSAVHSERWSGARAIELVTVEGGGHSVPHPETHGPRLLGRNNRDVQAAHLIWDFFQHAP